MVGREPDGRVLEEAAALYATAFAGAGRDPAQEAAGFVERARGYLHDRIGGRLAWVEDADDPSMLAMALGVIGSPGTWWRDQVAAFLGEPVTVQRVLGDRCLEVVHVATHPDHRRRGLGRAVLELLLADPPAPTAVLSCRPFPSAASRLYRSTGWKLVADGFAVTAGQEPFSIMYRPLT